MTSEEKYYGMGLIDYLRFYWIPLGIFGIGIVIIMTGIIEPSIWGLYLIIFSGVTAIAWTIFGRLF